jgi:hypothetical protein
VYRKSNLELKELEYEACEVRNLDGKATGLSSTLQRENLYERKSRRSADGSSIPSLVIGPNRGRGRRAQDGISETLLIKRRLSDLLLSLPQSLYGKPNTFLHAADGVG